MNYDLLTALITFALVSSFTPGPNNLMLMSSGANFGFQRTIPHMLGVELGFIFMMVMVGIGLMQLFDTYPISHEILKILSVGYLLYLSFKIGTATAPEYKQENYATPITFLQAASFQWVNPKAWTMALTAISIYAPSRSFESIAMVAIIFGMVSFPSVAVWTVLGQQLRRMLTSNTRLRTFNVTMAVLLLATLYPVFVQ